LINVFAFGNEVPREIKIIIIIIILLIVIVIIIQDLINRHFAH